MKKQIALSVLVVVCLMAVLCGCSASDAKPAPDGAMTAVYDDGGELTGYERRYHNADGELSRLDSYDKDKAYQSFVLYEYDSDGRLSSETTYAADGIAQYRYCYTYGDNGTLCEKAFEKPNGEAEVERYDEQGGVVEILRYDSDGNLIVGE